MYFGKALLLAVTSLVATVAAFTNPIKSKDGRLVPHRKNITGFILIFLRHTVIRSWFRSMFVSFHIIADDETHLSPRATTISQLRRGPTSKSPVR